MSIQESKRAFFVAGRNVSAGLGAISIAASWVWAPALFTSAEVTYKWGISGLLWFTVPNVLVLIIFGFFAHKTRTLKPNGFTLSDFMKDTYSRRVRNIYLTQLSSLAVCSFAVQMVAGGAVIALITGWHYGIVTVLMAATAMSYSITGGLKGSIRADLFHISVTLLVAVTFAPAVLAATSLDTILTGFLPANVDQKTLALTFGIPTTIGLLSGPFGDQSFWTRTFAIRTNQIRKAFTWSALIFATVPLLMAFLGAATSGAGLEVTDPSLSNVTAVYGLLPGWTIVPFIIMILGALISTMDNNLISFATLRGHDLTRRPDQAIPRGRVAMLVCALLGTLIANIPGITVTTLFLIYGTMRASTVGPTILTLTRKRLPAEAGIFYGILLALTIGLPIFIYASFTPDAASLKTVGSILTISISSLLALAWPARKGTK